MNHRQNRLAAGFWGRWVVFALVVSALTARAAIVSVGDFTALTNAISTGATGDTILLTNNITLSAELSVSAKGLTFEGNRYSISVPTPGLNESGVVNASPSVMRVFNINAIGKTNTIRNLLVKGGSPGASGGGILNTNGTLVLEGVTVTQSGGSSAGGGGLVNSSGMLFMRDCNISRNGAKHGGGFLNSGTLVMERCTFSENRSMSTMGGGGAGENQAQLYANNCTFANNKSTELGGAINNNNGTAFFVNCTFVGNIAYGIFQGGAIACNNGNVTLVNSLLAYNYRNNAGVYELNDIVKYSGNAPVAYSCIFQSTTSQLSASSTGVSLYPGNATGSDDSLFCAGATAKVLGPDGTQVGSGTIYQPFLAQTGLTPATVLKTNSFAFGKGVLTGFSSATLPAVVGFYNGSSWTTLSGSNPAGCEVTAGQDGNLIGVPLTAGSVNSTAASLFMLKVNSAAHGSVSGGTIYGDVYASGTTVTLTAIPDPGYAFTEWDYVLGGSGVASTANPFALTLASDVTLLPVFSLYNGFTVSYSGNGSTGGAVPSAQVIPLAGSATLAGAGAMVRSGYTFSGWNSRYDGNGTDFAPGATYNGPVNLSLYAKWALVPSPTITASPGSQTVAAGGTASLSVHATGDYPLTYQWFKNNAILPGATNSTLALANAAVTNSGVYYVVVTNVHGMSISWPAAVSAGMPQLMAWGWNDNGQLGDGTILTRSNAITVATNVVAAAGGYQHSLFVKGDGTLWTMGYNGVNQLGDGTSTERHSPVPVASNAVAVAAGSSHSLFIKDDGTLWAMGYNNAGQLGNGTLNEQSNAVAVIGGSNVVAVSAGFHHTLFLKGDGTLWGMGENDCGQLGDGTQVNSQAPKSVASNVVAVVAGRAHSLFIKRDLTLWAMGTNNSGQLGDGSTTLRTSPVCVASNVLAAAAGQYHSVYLKSDASLWAVGDNAYGQLGNLTKTDQILAVAVAGGTNVVAVAAGRYDSLFMKADNTLWTVGWNGHGELGDGGTSGSRSNAVAIPGMTLAGVSAGSSAYQAFAVGMPVAITTQPANQSVVATSNATFSVTATGIATVGYQWQLNGTNIAGATAASYTRTAAMAATAGNYTVAVSNLYGSITSSAAVLTVTKATPAVTAWPLASAITYGQTLASSVLSGGSAAVAGSFAFSTPSTAPAAGAASQGVVFTPADTANYNTVSGSVSVTVGKATPSVTVWPAASAITYGQTLASSSLSGGSAVVAGSFAFTTPSTAPGVGTASQAVVFNPTDTTDYNSVTGSVNVTVMKAPASVVFVESSLLAVYDGTAKAPASATTPGGLAVSLTYNGSSASPTNAGTYTVVGTISDAVYQGSVTSQFRIAMSGPAVAWGAGADYQLGNNAGTNSPFPVEVLASGVLAGKTIVAVAAGRYTSYALTSEGLVYAWGRNNAGQLGDGGSPVLDSQVPVMVSTNGALSGKRIVSIIASELGAMALSADAKLFTWGWNYRGALGNGSEVTWTNVPVAVDMSGALAGKTVAALGAGNAHYLVATSDGKVFGWGDGGYGQLGQGGSTASSTPVAVNMSGVLAGENGRRRGRRLAAFHGPDRRRLGVCLGRRRQRAAGQRRQHQQLPSRGRFDQRRAGGQDDHSH